MDRRVTGSAALTDYPRRILKPLIGNGFRVRARLYGITFPYLPDQFPIVMEVRESGAAYRIRTYDPIITNDVLYQLS